MINLEVTLQKKSINDKKKLCKNVFHHISVLELAKKKTLVF